MNFVFSDEALSATMLAKSFAEFNISRDQIISFLTNKGYIEDIRTATEFGLANGIQYKYGETGSKWPVYDSRIQQCILDNIEIINQDVLKTDLAAIIKEKFDGMPVYVCANLPYYITSPVIMALLESRLPIEAVTVMVQKEAAQRICAPVGSRLSGAVTVAVDYYAHAQKLFDVSAGSFMPAPKVDSCVIKMDIRKTPGIEITDEELFFRMVHAAFGQRRKTAANSISSGSGIPKDVVIKAIEECGFEPSVRAEGLTMQELAELSEKISGLMK